MAQVCIPPHATLRGMSSRRAAIARACDGDNAVAAPPNSTKKKFFIFFFQLHCNEFIMKKRNFN
jgi:hypothetical protein